MLSSPYPVPNLASYKLFMVAGWLAGIAAGLWVIINPPKPYEGIGLTLTTTWGAFLVAGGALVAIGHAARKYKIEIPGLLLSLGGVVIYDYLSWVQTFTDTLGSGPRALLLALLACLIMARLRVLWHVDREGRRMALLRTRGGRE